MQSLRTATAATDPIPHHCLVLCDSQAVIKLLEAGLAVQLPNVLHKSIVCQIRWWGGSKHGKVVTKSKAHRMNSILIKVKRGESEIDYISIEQVKILLRFLDSYDARLKRSA
jgi:hypothetical protein